MTRPFFFSTSGTPFIFRVGQGSEMERAVKLDQELTEYGRGVLLTDTLSVCLKKAAQWAQTGLVVSIGPVGLLEGGADGDKSAEGSGDPEIVCKARNSRLSRFVLRLLYAVYNRLIIHRFKVLLGILSKEKCNH